MALLMRIVLSNVVLGTPGYVAPEILTAGSGVSYGNKVDVFSAGVTLYVLLCGYEPFYGESEKELIEANKKAELEFPQSDWGKGTILSIAMIGPFGVLVPHCCIVF
jgi:serine/threonine protein kinase